MPHLSENIQKKMVMELSLGKTMRWGGGKGGKETDLSLCAYFLQSIQHALTLLFQNN